MSEQSLELSNVRGGSKLCLLVARASHVPDTKDEG